MPDLVELISNRRMLIEQRIFDAAKSAGRKSEDARLVVVTKNQPVEVVEAAILAGCRVLGENYPEESVGKIQILRENYSSVEWHMIGHLQSRKTSLVALHFDYFESLDRVEIAEKLNGQLAITGRKLPVLLEFNTAGEISKSGWNAASPKDWPGFLPDVERVAALPYLEIRGLMTMPPLFTDPEQTRPYFRCLRSLRDYLAARMPGQKWSELSMGTSGDFEVAVKEGATIVRIGTAILGQRPVRV